MASNRAGLAIRAILMAVALTLLAFSLATPGLVAARIVAAAGALAAGWLLWRHLDRTERAVARFVEALAHDDLQRRFATGSEDRIGTAFDAALARLRAAGDTANAERQHIQTLLDDMPVALLVVEADRVELANKAARRLFAGHSGARPDSFARYSPDLPAVLAGEVPAPVTLALDTTRVLVRSAALTRLGRHSRAVTVEPVHDALNAVEMAAQADIVRVLTHEILGSLTPVRSLAATAATLMAEIDDPRLADAQEAVATLARRAEGLGRFVERYRAIAREPVPQRRAFLAQPFADEMARLFAADWPAVTLTIAAEPPDLALDADPDLLAQAILNLLRNAAEAGATAVTLAVTRGRLEVADDGPGVPEALRRDVFLPFFTTRANGTGVGLNLVRRIAVAHGGGVEVDTSPTAGGARFRLTL